MCNHVTQSCLRDRRPQSGQGTVMRTSARVSPLPNRSSPMVRRASLPSLQRDESPSVLKRMLSHNGGVNLSPADLTTGFYPAPKITSYDPAKMSTLKAVFTHRHLTVFAGTCPVLVNLLWLVYALTLALVLVYADGPDGSMQPTYLHALRIGDGAVLEFRVLSAFVLGGFVLLVVDAWQTRRGNYSSLVSSAKTFLIHVGSSLPLTQPRAGNSREQPNDLQATRSRLARWVLLAVEVTVFHARGLIDDPTTRKYLEGPAGLLLPGEWERLQPKERHTTCFYWISMQLKLLAAHGYISARELTHLHAALITFRKESNDVMHRMEGDLPYPYASLLGCIVYINIFLQSSKNALACVVLYPPLLEGAAAGLAAPAYDYGASSEVDPSPSPSPAPEPGDEPESSPEPESGRRLNEQPLGGDSVGYEIGKMAGSFARRQLGSWNSKYFAEPKPWSDQAPMWTLQLLCMVSVNMAYFAFFMIQANLYSPFGPRHIDIPHEAMLENLRRLATSLLEAPSSRIPNELCAEVESDEVGWWQKAVDGKFTGSLRQGSRSLSGPAKEQDGTYSVVSEPGQFNSSSPVLPFQDDEAQADLVLLGL